MAAERAYTFNSLSVLPDPETPESPLTQVH